MSENDKEKNQIQENDEKMAIKFPDWDLLPPDVLIKRKKNDQ